MSVRQDQFTFFGVLIAVVVVVLGYLQLGQLYPVAGREDVSVDRGQGVTQEDGVRKESASLEGDAQP